MQKPISARPSLIGITLDAQEMSCGMAVYCGFDVSPHRSVAVKVLSNPRANCLYRSLSPGGPASDQGYVSHAATTVCTVALPMRRACENVCMTLIN